MEGTTTTKPIYVHLPARKHRRLKTMAARQGTTVTMLVNRAIDRLFERETIRPNSDGEPDRAA